MCRFGRETLKFILLSAVKPAHCGGPANSHSLERADTNPTMLIDLEHEIDVLKAVFARQAAWISTEFARISSSNAQRQNIESDEIEAMLFNPHGPGSAEEVLCRSTICELNALIEFSLQDTLMRITGEQFFPLNAKEGRQVDLVYRLNRKTLESQLLAAGLDISGMECYVEVQQIREITEGFKHRQRLRPVPQWDKNTKSVNEVASIVPGSTHSWFSSYELEMCQVHEYVMATGKFIKEISLAHSRGAP